MMDESVNYYELLEVSPDASLQEIYQAYKKAKSTYSTSNTALYSIFNEEEAHELNKLIEEAYSVLSNPEQKENYDRKIKSSSSHQTSTDDFETDEPSITPHWNEEPEEPTLSPSSTESETVSTSMGTYVKEGVIHKDYDIDPEFEEKMRKLEICSGYFLRKTRQYKNISIEEVSQFSRISKTNILALENEDLEALPARVFIRGFVIQVSKLLGLESQKFTNGYMKIVDENKRN